MFEPESPANEPAPMGAAVDALRGAAVQLAALGRTIRGGVLLEDRDRKVVLANARFCELFAISTPPDALVGDDCARYAQQAKASFVDPDAYLRRITQLVEGAEPGLGDELQLADGRAFRRDYLPLFDGQVFAGHLWHFEDLSAQRAAQRAAERCARLQELARRVIGALFEERGVTFGVDLVLGEAGRLLGLRVASVARHVAAQGGLVESVEWRPGEPLRRGGVVAIPWLERATPMATGLLLRVDEGALPGDVGPGERERKAMVEALAREGFGSAFVAMLMVFGRPEAVFLFACGGPGDSAVGAAQTPALGDEECAILQSIVDGLGRALERRALERERRSHGQELSAALQRAEAASRFKTQFVAYLSHEIRNPIGAIEGYAALLEQPPYSGHRNAEIAGHLRRNAEHLLVLVNDILDLSRVEMGQLEVRRGPQRLAELVDEVVAVMQNRASAKRITLSVQWPARVPTPFETDPTRFKQILLNLVGNAIKFTDVGGVVIRVEVELPAVPRRPMLSIAVIDSGKGIPQDRIATLFHPFTQAHDDSAQLGGAGLGLAICRALVRILGGDIVVTSQVGAGTTMTVRLELGPAERLHLGPVVLPAAAGAGAQARLPQGASDPILAGKRVLSVDDSVDNLRIARFLLERAGMKVEEAHDGAQCVAMVLGARAEGNPFDAILLDMGMPEVDGYEAARRLRASSVDTPILALTAHVFAEEKARCLTAGCDVYLTKPVDAGKLYAALAAQLRLIAQDQQLLAPTSAEAPAAVHGAAPDAPDLDAPSAPAEPTTPVRSPSARPSPLASANAGATQAPHAGDRVFEDPSFAPLLARYLANLPARLADLVRSTTAGDRDRVSTLCHQIRGSAASYGFPAISEAAAACEERLREGADLAQASPLLDGLVRALQAAIPQGSPPG